MSEFPMTLTAVEYARVHQRRKRATSDALMLPGCDPGIRPYVAILSEAGVETHQSCQGGPYPERPEQPLHAYPEPTIDFDGSDGAGWWALQVCIDHGLPVKSLNRTWSINGGLPTGPIWRLVFSKMAEVEP